MRENYTLVRLYLQAHDDLSPDVSAHIGLKPGAVIELSKPQCHYLVNVLRKGAGDELRVFNSQDGEWRAMLSTVSKKSAQLEIISQLRLPMASPDIGLYFAPLRKHRTAFIAEKAAELGAAYLQPVITQRTQFPKLNLEKMRLQVIEASEQTERLDIPQVKTPVSFDDMLTRAGEGRIMFFADEAGGALPAADAIRQHAGKAGILIGPEGGFTPQEREQLLAAGSVVPISLGPRILRADTAALSVLTLWQSMHGDWSQ